MKSKLHRWRTALRARTAGIRMSVARRLREDRRGNAAVVMAASMLPVMAAAGLATDGLSAMLVRDKMQSALDAAALAAGRVMLSGDPTVDARRFFDANFAPGYLGSTVTQFDVGFTGEMEQASLQAAATVPTRFMRIFGRDHVGVAAKTVVMRRNRSAELALVLDVTGSMDSKPAGETQTMMEAMRASAHDLVEILYGQNETRKDLWVGIVPYAATVNVGTGNAGWLAAADRVNTSAGSFAPSSWKGCVMARGGDGDRSDDTPAEAPFTSYFWASDVDNVWPPLKESWTSKNNGTGPNLGCPVAILPLVAEKSRLVAKLDELVPAYRGGTLGNLGLVWGWRMLSPRWRGTWAASPEPLPLDYRTPSMEKIVVMMTDGENQLYDWPDHEPNKGKANGPRGSDFSAYGRLNDFGYSKLTDGRAEVDRRMSETCEKMKAEGIVLYTITFGSTPKTATQNLYKNCATTPKHYFHAPTNDVLRETFRTIGGEISQLRIVR